MKDKNNYRNNNNNNNNIIIKYKKFIQKIKT